MARLSETTEIPQVLCELQQHLDALWERRPQTAQTLTEALLGAIREAESLIESDQQPQRHRDLDRGDLDIDQDPTTTADQFSLRAADVAYHRSMIGATLDR